MVFSLFAGGLSQLLSGSGLAVMIALKHFDAADWQKGLLASAVPFGLLITPLIVYITSRAGLAVSRALFFLEWLTIPGFLLAAFAETLEWFMAGVLLSVPLLAARTPLYVAAFRQNVETTVRGRVFSLVLLVANISAVCVSLAVTAYMGEDAGAYRWVFVVFAALMFLGSLGTRSIPTQPLGQTEHLNPLRNLRLLWQDRFFGYMCCMQMLIGIGNLATIPLRTEYAGSDSRGVGHAPDMILLLTVILPGVFRVLAVPLAGRLFDHMNFMHLRMIVNALFAGSIVLFFTRALWTQVLGSVLFGIAFGGGGVLWHLWVTKFCEPEHTADYVSVHTFLTGLRGALMPLVAFSLLAWLSIEEMGWIAFGCILVSILMLIPVIPRGRLNAVMQE